MVSMKLLKLSVEPGQMHRMSSMYLFHKSGSTVECASSFSSSSAIENVGIGRGHFGAHGSSLYLVVHGVAKLKVVVCENNLEEVLHGSWRNLDLLRVGVFLVQSVCNSLDSLLVGDVKVQCLDVYGCQYAICGDCGVFQEL